MQATELESRSFSLEFVSLHLLVAMRLVHVERTNVDARARASQHLPVPPSLNSIEFCLICFIGMTKLIYSAKEVT